MKIEAVVFDVGETLIDETGVWSAWADWIGVPRFAFMAMFGLVIERDEGHRKVFEYARPGIDVDAEIRARREAGHIEPFTVDDLYSDVPEAFRELASAGFRLAIAGNQPNGAEIVLNRLGLPVELVVASERWGVHKPSAAFFERLATELVLAPGQIAYVGDRLDNDILPANEAGMVSVFIRRGPWGFVHARRTEAAQADIRIESLLELPAILATWNASHAN